MGAPQELKGPDLAAGITEAALEDQKPFLGHAGGEPVVMVRFGSEICAVGATCSHYGGPLAEGIVEQGTIRCPWHHARFDLRSGAATRPGRDAIPCFRVHREGGRVRVGERVAPERAARRNGPDSVVIVGAGAAGNACAEELRLAGYEGPITLFGVEGGTPVDRPNLSKDYLAGTAPEDWVPLRGAEFYSERGIELRGKDEVAGIDTDRRLVRLSSGATLPYGALLLATGAEPVRLPIPGADMALTLRSFEDAKAIAGRATTSTRAVVIGASFIGLEVAASLRTRGAEVAIVAPETRPLERVLGPEIGDFVRSLHEKHGVVFHLGRKPAKIDAASVTLDDGSTLPADLVVMGVGVRPRLRLAEDAKLSIDRGVLVDKTLRTSAEGIWAAGDIARFPDPQGGPAIRIEHWVVAERQGQHAARAMLGDGAEFREVPFFWSQHYDASINYVGHAESWDSAELLGSIESREWLVAYRQAGAIRAVASLGRDQQSLRIEAALERGDAASVEKALR